MNAIGTLAAKLAIGMVARLMTERFLSKLLVEALRAWSRQTENEYDDRVAEAVAEAFDIPPDIIVIK